MKNLFDHAAAEEVQERLTRLRPDTPRQWGKMTAPQMVAHCATALEFALGDRSAPRVFIGRLVGPFVKRAAIGNERPLRRNTPTLPELISSDARDLSRERERLRSLIDRFVTGGPGACTTNPHSFFGPMKPEEWAVLAYKHLDHHLRQFGV